MPDFTGKHWKTAAQDLKELAGGRKKLSVGITETAAEGRGKGFCRKAAGLLEPGFYMYFFPSGFLQAGFLRAVELGYELQVAVFFVIVEAVTNYENIWNIKTLVVYRDLNNPACIYVNQSADFEAGRVP